MASYVESTLISDEHIIYRGQISLWSLAPYFIVGFLLIAFYLIGLLIIAYAIIKYKTTELAITNKRIIAKFGWISRSTIELNINKIESIQVQQGILGRILNFGTLIISGAGNPQAPIPNISNPMEFRRVYMGLQK
ncbi:PH domain-containing protein [Sulfuricurvum sp. IAE1]|uniref:PH domain-containing protein n=1 Tax=Sulfuricurvum sp. IAE1 TaxID=2546102 RepID=UPI001046FFE9|nr:PH domain-containing protein [Sulfuricurvum sp. IAE1]TDA68457.1 PH domain-containing protein [Sulfuricurvum sp. IAE1]